MDGLLIIDKPRGMTSFEIVRRVRRLLGTRRVGHAGTLDPLATGVLPVAVGKATRLVQFLMDGEKAYRATLKLGEITDTQDAEGHLLETRPVPELTVAQIEAAARPLTGNITQVPPMFSALKRDGVPLYRLARQGIEVEREAREITVRRLEILEMQLPLVVLEVDCSKGTYVRTLAHDLGLALGTGAHLVSLRRTRCGHFTEDDAITLERLEALVAGGLQLPILAPVQALRGYPSLEVDAAATRRLGDGIPPAVADVVGTLPRAGAIVSLLRAGELLAVARYVPERIREQRGDFELLCVFHQPHDR